MSDSANDAARWRKPEEELPEVGVQVEAWAIDLQINDAPNAEDCVYWDGEQWISEGASWFSTVTCLAWRPIQPIDKPSWIP